MSLRRTERLPESPDVNNTTLRGYLNQLVRVLRNNLNTLEELSDLNAANLIYNAYTTSAVDYTLLTTDRIIKVTVTGTTITLPTAIGVAGQVYIIDNAAGGAITVDTTLSQTIQGITSQTIPTQSAMSVYSDGANWRIF